MKFDRYLKEISKVDIKEVDSIVGAALYRFWTTIDKHKIKFWPLIWSSLNMVFMEISNIGIVPDVWPLAKKIKGASGSITQKGTILIFFKPNELKKLAKRDQTQVNRLFSVVSHELVHRKQLQKMPEKSKESALRKEEAMAYIARPSEIEAFAREAAYNMSSGNTNAAMDIIYAYNEVKKFNEDVWKKFRKKLYQYTQMDKKELEEIENL